MSRRGVILSSVCCFGDADYMACVFFVPKVQRGRARRGNRKYVGISMRAVSPVVYGSLGSAL